MAFSSKTWKRRLTEYPNRRRLTKEDGTTEIVTVARLEGTISQEGDAFSEENMNDLERRIAQGFDDVQIEALTTMEQVQASTDPSIPAGAGAVNELAMNFSGCWIAFEDANGNPTDEPYIHWEV